MQLWNFVMLTRARADWLLHRIRVAKLKWLCWWMLWSRWQSWIASEAKVAIAMYSASMLERKCNQALASQVPIDCTFKEQVHIAWDRSLILKCKNNKTRAAKEEIYIMVCFVVYKKVVNNLKPFSKKLLQNIQCFLKSTNKAIVRMETPSRTTMYIFL